MAEVEMIARERGIKHTDLSADALLYRQHSVIGKEITKFLKRLRKNSGVPLRYLLVLE